MASPLTLDLLGLVAVIFLVLLNGFFVAAEFSLVSVRQTRITELVEQGNPTAEEVQKALENPDRVIAATQLGITLASLGRIPEVQDTVESGKIMIQVEAMDGLRIDRLKLTCLEDKPHSAQLPAERE